MKLFDEISNIYILVEPCDLRKGIDGYASIVRSEFHLDPMHTGNLYIFCNKYYFNTMYSDRYEILINKS